MATEDSSYRRMLKSTSLFGGVQIFNILISIIRSKIVAILLGPAGMGILGLFTSTLNLVNGITGFGLGTSIVRFIATSTEKDNTSASANIISISRILIWITGIAGALLTIIFAPWLSQATFGNKYYTKIFYWLSLSIVFNQIFAGRLAELQGSRKLRQLAKANVISSLLALIISIPLYYFYKLKGIPFAIIATSVSVAFTSVYYSQKNRISSIKVPYKDFLFKSRDMLRIGILLSISNFATLGGSYLLRIFINSNGSVDDVGFYNAAFAIIGGYVGMVFTAMGTDYYPRLSSVCSDHKATSLLINQQAVIAILILGPLLAIFLIFVDLGVIILYSRQFLPIIEIVQWGTIAIYFKAVGWAIAYSFLANGNGRVYVWNEIGATIYLLILNIIGYWIWGLRGLGISYLVGYLLYFLQVFIVTSKLYDFRFNNIFIRVFSTQLLIGIACLLIAKFVPKPWLYLGGILLICISVYFFYKELSQLVKLPDFLKRIKRKRI